MSPDSGAVKQAGEEKLVKTVLALLFAVMTLFGQTVQIPRGAQKMAPAESGRIQAMVPARPSSGTANFPGFIREEGNQVFVYMTKVTAGASVFARTSVLGGSFSTDSYNFTEDNSNPDGQVIFGVSVPRVIGAQNVVVEAFEMGNGGMISYTSYVYDATYAPQLVVAAYEIPFSMLGATKSPTVVKVVGYFDPAQPAIIFAGSQRIPVKVISSTSGQPRETLLLVPDTAMINYSTSYLFTVCQSFLCVTTKVAHLDPDAGNGPKGD
ncbi:MAG: hypothetical protein WCK48_03385 [bacterium]